MPSSVTWPQVAALRFDRQHLARREPASALVDVVRDMVGLQAQVASAAELQAVARIDGLRTADVRDALADGRTLVKTWAMRGTLHLLAADDLPAFVAAFPTRDNTSSAAWVRYFGLTPEDLARVVTAIDGALSATPMTRAELGEAVGHALRDPRQRTQFASGWGTILKPAAGRGVLCFGPDRGRNVTFVRPADWLGRPIADPQPGDAEVALGRLIERWLRVFPGAGRGDAARWWGAGSGPLMTRSLAAAGVDVDEIDVDGARGWLLREDADALAAAEPIRAVRLLPLFDPWVANLPRGVDALLPTAHADRVYRVAGWITAVLLVDGRVAGTWEIESGRRGGIAIQPFGRTRSIRAELAAEVERIAAYLGRPLPIRLAPSV